MARFVDDSFDCTCRSGSCPRCDPDSFDTKDNDRYRAQDKRSARRQKGERDSDTSFVTSKNYRR